MIEPTSIALALGLTYVAAVYIFVGNKLGNMLAGMSATPQPTKKATTKRKAK